MIQVQLPRTIEGSLTTPKLSKHTINQIFTQGSLVSRPSCDRVASLSVGHARGTFIWNDTFYSVYGQKFCLLYTSPSPRD